MVMDRHVIGFQTWDTGSRSSCLLQNKKSNRLVLEYFCSTYKQNYEKRFSNLFKNCCSFWTSMTFYRNGIASEV